MALDPQVRDLLDMKIFVDTDPDIRKAAASALGQTHEQVAIMALGNALEDKDPAMQFCAVVSLRKVSGQDLGNDVDRWRAAVKDGSLQPAGTATLAGRLRHWF